MSNVIQFPGPVYSWLDDYAVETRDVAKVILAGLKSAGVKAEQGKAWSGGKFAGTLDLAIDIPDPWSHRSRDGMTFAKVRLLVDPFTGTLTVKRDESRGNDCPHCGQQEINRWLWTCRGHDENGHPDHEPGWISVDDFRDDVPDEEIVRIMGGSGDEVVTDDSPMGHVFAAMEKADAEFRARYEIAHPEYVEEQMRCLGVPEQDVADRVEARIERAKVLLRSGSKQIGPTEVEIEDWTEASAAEWLAEHDIPATATYREAWTKAKEIDGHPPKQWVEAGHRLRKDKE